jgi:hypothetical protein
MLDWPRCPRVPGNLHPNMAFNQKLNALENTKTSQSSILTVVVRLWRDRPRLLIKLNPAR